MRPGTWGGVDIRMTHEFQTLMLDGPDIMNQVTKKQVANSLQEGITAMSEGGKYLQEKLSKKYFLLFYIEICTLNDNFVSFSLTDSQSENSHFELMGWLGREKAIKSLHVNVVGVEPSLPQSSICWKSSERHPQSSSETFSSSTGEVILALRS